MQKAKRKLKKSSKIIIAALLIVIISIAIVSFLFLDSKASAATSTKTFTPTSYPVGVAPGNALLVFDPGSTGAVENAAKQIASDLQAKGYFVFLAGIDSKTAMGNAAQYQVVVVGGPIESGQASKSVQSYLVSLNQYNLTLTRLGVFGVGNSNTPNDQIAPLPTGSSLVIKETLEINTSQNIKTQASEFVSQLLS